MLTDVPADSLPLLSIVVPARDEARSIERCIRSLLAQRGLEFEVIAVDDRSRDATPAILARLAAENARLRVVTGAPLPHGWVGKPWALFQGTRDARGAWLLFTDADSAHAPLGAASALWFARAFGADALSIATCQELGTIWERAVLPSILGMLLFVAGPLGDINDPRKPRKALANGQYLLVSRSAYDALGGHAALHGEVVEDIAFARRIKSDGRFRFLLTGGTALASVRMYRSLGEIWNGFTKNVYLGAEGDLLALGGGFAFMTLISVAPPVLALLAMRRRRYAAALEASACTAAVIATAAWGMRRAGFPARLALYAPAGCAFFAGVIANSTRRMLTGRGVEWRGRTYFGRPSSRTDLIDE